VQLQCLQRAPGRRVTEKSHFSALNVGLAGTGNRTQATCLAGSVSRRSAIHFAIHTQRFETAARTKKKLSGAAAMAAFTEQGVGANAVCRGHSRGRGTDTGAKVREPWVCPNLPYTEEQCKKILAWYNTRELCSKWGNKKKKGDKHACPAGGSTCKKCKRTGHYDPHCFANRKLLTETCNVSGQGFSDADYTSLQV
jgi:hypothetical protein